MESHHLIGIKTSTFLCIVLILFLGGTSSPTITPSWFSKRHGSLFAVGHELGERSVTCSIECRDQFVTSCVLEKYGKLPDYGLHGRLAKELCHISNGEWQIGAKPTFQLLQFQRFLIGEGSHRLLVSSIKYQIRVQPNPVTDHYGQPCELVLVERLRPGVFADPFELQRLVQRGVFTDAAVFGDTNLELPSALSNQSVVEVRLKINHVLDGNSREHEITVALPLHARYPPLGEGSFSTVEIGLSDMMIRCKHQVSSYSWILYSLDSKLEDTLRWMVPRGKESHAYFVSVVTPGSALISALVIVLASVYSLQMRGKRSL